VIAISAAAIPAVATNAVEAISSFFIFKFLVYVLIFRTSAGESSEIYNLFDDFIVIGQESQSFFSIDYYDWCKLVTPLGMNIFGQTSGSSVIKY